MHGRICALSALTITMAFAAGTAQADQTMGLGDTAAFDGVVTSWTVQGATGETVRLRSVQDVGRTTSPATITTATSDAVTPTASPQTIAARLPIAAGGRLMISGGNGSETVTATVAPDADGDGYGDGLSGQDPCTQDFTDHARPCGPTRTFGSPLTLAPDPDGFPGGGSPVQAWQGFAPIPTHVPADGILTRFRLRTTTDAGPTVLQVLRPSSDGTSFVVVAETGPVAPATDDVVTVPAAFAVKTGDVLAARAASGQLGAVAYRSGDRVDYRQAPSLPGGPSFGATGSAADRRLLVQADVEPDADRDGKGDVSQDQADLVLTGSGPSEVGPLESATQSFTVRNAGPDKALDVAIAFVRNGDLSTTADRPGVSCGTDIVDGVDGAAWVCRIGTLVPGESVTVVPGRDTELVPVVGPTVTTVATAVATTSDPDRSNNAMTLTTTRRPYVPNLPPQAPLVAPPCSHVERGTRDDDVLRGTVFGDRLVGGDGGDLLKGGAGEDCLEGGAGNDVLDGGDGNDRLNGSSGKDRLAGGTGDDRLTGGKGNDRLSGGPGNDTISPGDGHDVVDAGGGNDTINSVDGVRETVECGAGRDTVRADRRDRLKHCEKVTRRR